MRLFQNYGTYPSYRPRLDQLIGSVRDFAGQRDIFLQDRFGSAHFLKPVLDQDQGAFFTNGDDTKLQRAWASEHGMKPESALEDILLAQIENHRTDVLYNLDPMRYGNSFLKRMPGSVKRAVTWRAAPSAGGDFSNYDLILNNFPSLLEVYRQAGMRAEYFAPAHDPVMDRYSVNSGRSVDILFVGGYSRHHRTRAAMLEAVAALSARYKVVFHLDRSRMTRLAETPAGWLGPLRKHRRPSAIRQVSADPVFGLELYEAISRSKIVINGAVDMAGRDRGNMRCWEAMGCGALLLSDTGHYPEGMVDKKTMITYTDAHDIVVKAINILESYDQIQDLAIEANAMIKKVYSKENQWQCFQELVS
jgi:hypothetical protein